MGSQDVTVPVVNNHGEYISPLRIGLWTPSIRDLLFWLINRDYQLLTNWDDPPGKVFFIPKKNIPAFVCFLTVVGVIVPRKKPQW